MVQINFASKQVTAKVVYYGPGMSGKTTNIEVVHQRAPDDNRGDLTSISTDGDRTLFFDYMPLDLGTVAGMRTTFQLYTVPGQVYYNSTRKLVLQGVDGVIFIADSSQSMTEQNLESLRNLEENLNEYGKSLASLPWVIQYNKRDLPDALPVDELNELLNQHGVPAFEGVASSGQGVFPTLKCLAARVLQNVMSESANAVGGRPVAPRPAPRPQAASPAAPRASAAAPRPSVGAPQSERVASEPLESEPRLSEPRLSEPLASPLASAAPRRLELAQAPFVPARREAPPALAEPAPRAPAPTPVAPARRPSAAPPQQGGYAPRPQASTAAAVEPAPRVARPQRRASGAAAPASAAVDPRARRMPSEPQPAAGLARKHIAATVLLTLVAAVVGALIASALLGAF